MSKVKRPRIGESLKALTELELKLDKYGENYSNDPSNRNKADFFETMKKVDELTNKLKKDSR
jgi:hypothetical protein